VVLRRYGINRLIRQNLWIASGDTAAEKFIRDSESLALETDKGLPGRAWTNKQTFWTGELTEVKGFVRQKIANEAGFVSAVAIPVPERDGSTGVLIFFGRSSRIVDDDILASLYEIAMQTGHFIQRKKLETELEIEHRELTNRVEERTAELKNAKIMAEAANNAKSDFLASMSHELRTPLNSIIGFSEVMIGGMAGEMTDEQKEYLNDIYSSGKHLLSLINDILDLSKVEAGKMELITGPVSAGEIIQTALSLFREKTFKHRITLVPEVNLAAGDDVFIADERKIKQILYNLVSNAVKFTSEGGTVTIRVGKNDQDGTAAIRFDVIDTGIGISADNQTKLFHPFQQIDNTSTRSYDGTGLGLSICKGYVELHGGSISVMSEEGKGSTFSFTIPLR